MSLTPEQRRKLHLAIDRAQGPGECSYAKGCVIAQLLLLEGATQEDLYDLDREWFGKSVQQLYERDIPQVCRLVDSGYSVAALQEIQKHWDRQEDEASACRTRMHALVDGEP